MKINDYSIELFNDELIKKKQISVRETKGYFVTDNHWLPVSATNFNNWLYKEDLRKVQNEGGYKLHMFSIRDLSSSELIKLKIDFINEITIIVDKIKLDLEKKENIINLLQSESEIIK